MGKHIKFWGDPRVSINPNINSNPVLAASLDFYYNILHKENMQLRHPINDNKFQVARCVLYWGRSSLYIFIHEC